MFIKRCLTWIQQRSLLARRFSAAVCLREPPLLNEVCPHMKRGLKIYIISLPTDVKPYFWQRYLFIFCSVLNGGIRRPSYYKFTWIKKPTLSINIYLFLLARSNQLRQGFHIVSEHLCTLQSWTRRSSQPAWSVFWLSFSWHSGA